MSVEFGSPQQIEAWFRAKNPNPNIVVHGLTDLGGDLVLSVSTPFVYDRRERIYPFGDLPIKYGYIGELPPEFEVPPGEKGYVWAPERFEAFVDRASDEIRTKLGNPQMTRDEMLDALSWNGDFQVFKRQCAEWEMDRKIPPYVPPRKALPHSLGGMP